jgi:hypothetical protein
MCVVSMIGDHYSDKWRQPYREFVQPVQWPTYTYPQVSKEEFDALKVQVAELVELMKRAKIYDAKNGEPDCETDEKMAVLRKVAKLVGIDLDKAIGA